MSVLPRGSRSRSRPAPDTKEERLLNRASTIPVAHSPISSTPHSATAFLCPPSTNRAKSVPHDIIDMVDTIAVQKALDSLASGPPASVAVMREQSADHSSSLSELEDNLDERDEPKSKIYLQQLDGDEDSEAETERLEETPQKQRSDLIGAYTPSRLGNEIRTHENADADSVSPGEPRSDLVVESIDDHSPSSPLSDDPEATPRERPHLLETPGRKRKREINQDDQETELEVDEPARKRAGGVESDHIAIQDDDGLIELRQPLEDSPPPLDSVENEDETIDEQPIPVKAAKGKKQKGRGKKGRGKANDSLEKPNNVAVDDMIVEPEELGEVEAEDEEAGSPAEQVQQKRIAFDKFSGLDATFKALREVLLDEQIARLDQELLQINQTPCQHPEYLAMMTCINARRDEAIAKEQFLLYYKEKDLRTRFVAERQIIQSQYVQTAREVREQTAGKCYSKLYALQRDRRRWGADDKTYGYMFNPKRSDQIKQQRAYNTEVSILSGMAKYSGFPAAPEIKGLHEDEADEDLRKMGMHVRQPQAIPFATHTHAENWRQAYPMSTGMETRSLSNPYTPAGQLRQADIHAPNGSASTIDMNSNPPSSAQAGPGSAAHTEMVRQESNETPMPPQVRRFMSGQQNSPFYTASALATEYHSPAPNNRASAEASTSFSYVSPSSHAAASESAANALRNELAEAARREDPLQRIRSAVGTAASGVLLSR